MVKAKKLMSSGFKSPNYTQVPNDFFTYISDMEESELRVTLVMIRETFGYHRKNFRMGIKKLAAATGLSLNGARAGAEFAETRGTFRRMNPSASGSAEWELIVIESENGGSSTSEEGSLTEPLSVQSMNWKGSTSELLSGIKESNKEKERNTTSSTQNNFVLYESNIGPLTPMIADAIKDAEQTYSQEWVSRAILEAAKSNVRNMKYIEAILHGYAQRGSPDISKNTVKPIDKNLKAPKGIDVVQTWLSKKETNND